MTFHHLQLVGARGFKLGRTPAIPEPALFPEYEMGANMELPLQDPPYLVCRLQDRPIDGMILESHRTELTPCTIRHLFEPAVPCWARLEAALVRSAIPELMKPRRNAELYLAMLHGPSTDAEMSMQNAGQLELIEHAFEILAAAGLCEVREIVGEGDPPGVRRMKVEWTELAYVEGTAVRQKSLTEEEEGGSRIINGVTPEVSGKAPHIHHSTSRKPLRRSPRMWTQGTIGGSGVFLP